MFSHHFSFCFSSISFVLYVFASSLLILFSLISLIICLSVFCSRILHNSKRKALYIICKGRSFRGTTLFHIPRPRIRRSLPECISLKSCNGDHSGTAYLRCEKRPSAVRFKSYLPPSCTETAFQPGLFFIWRISSGQSSLTEMMMYSSFSTPFTLLSESHPMPQAHRLAPLKVLQSC